MEFLGIGVAEFFFIFLIALMVLGPRRLPEYAAKAGKLVRDLRNMSQGLMTEWQREIAVATRIEELEETRRELKEAHKMLRETQQSIGSETKQVAAETSKAVTDASKAIAEMPPANADAPKRDQLALDPKTPNDPSEQELVESLDDTERPSSAGSPPASAGVPPVADLDPSDEDNTSINGSAKSASATALSSTETINE